MLSDWSINVAVLHMIGWSMMNTMLRDMIPEGLLLDVTVSQQENKIQRTSYFS
jgi:hypothetical protein